MKLEFTADAITSPVNDKNVIVNKATITTDTGFNMALELVDDNLNQRPIDPLDAERCSHYGIWLATFWRNDVVEPLLKMVVGSTQLYHPNTFRHEPGFCGLEAYVAEGSTPHDSLRCLLSLTAEKLMMPLPYPALSHYVVDEYIELATWMLENNLATVTKNELRAVRIVDGCKMERLWSIRRGAKPELKQTLVSFNPQQTLRQTMLVEKSHHVPVKAADLEQITARYAMGNVQAAQLHQQAQAATGGIPYGHPLMQMMQYLQNNGFDQKLIRAIHEEALKKPHLFQQTAQPMMAAAYGAPYPMPMPMMAGHQNFGYGQMSGFDQSVRPDSNDVNIK